MIILTHQNRQLLIDSRKRALDVLSKSEEAAKRVIQDAEAEMTALLLEQQSVARELLVLQFDDDDHLIKMNQLAAEALLASQRAEADTLTESANREAIDILCEGQREAAAILLQAHMKVSDSSAQPSNEQASQ